MSDRPIDPRKLLALLEAGERPDGKPWPEQLGDLAEAFADVSAVFQLADTIAEKAKLRSLIHAGRELASGAYHPLAESKDLAERHVQRVSVIVGGPSGDAKRTAPERYKPCPTERLPDPVGRFVAQRAEGVGCDTSFIALPTLSGLAAAIGNNRVLELRPGWPEKPIVWTGVLGESGSGKTPAMQAALAPIHQRQAAAMRVWAEQRKRYETGVAQSGRGAKPAEPKAERFVVSDATVEALALLLADNPRGPSMLVVCDELASLIGGFGQYKHGRGGDCAFYLSLASGVGVTIDRRTGDRRTICIPSTAVSVTGAIQPAAFDRLLGAEHRENGLLPRFLLAMPPRRPRRWTDATVPAETLAAMDRVFDRLYGLRPDTTDRGEAVPHVCHLTDDAKAAFVRFVNEHGEEQATLTGTLASAWSKLEAYAARFALLFHCVRVAAGDPVHPDFVEADSVAAAVTLVRWFAGEARRVYGALDESHEARERRQLADWIAARPERSATARDLTHGLRRFRDDPQGAEAALADLAAAGYGELSYPSGPKPGRPTQTFRLAGGVAETPRPDHVSGAFGYGDAVTGCKHAEDEAGNDQTDIDHASETHLPVTVTETEASHHADVGFGDGPPVDPAYADAHGDEGDGREGGEP